jgi:hypothetical protein
VKDLKSNISNLPNGSIELEITKASYKKVSEEEAPQHKSFMRECMANSEMHANTEGLDKDRTHMACAIAYDQKYKTAYAPCVPGVGCFY